MKLGFNSLRKILRFEEELGEVKRLFFLNLLVILIVLVLLLESKDVVLLKKGLALSFELLEVLKEGVINFLNAVDHDHYEDIIRTDSRLHQFVYVLCHSRQSLLQHFPVFSRHADTDTKLTPLVLLGLLPFQILRLTHANLIYQRLFGSGQLLEERNIVVGIGCAQLVESGEFSGDGLEGREAVFVVIDAVILEDEHESLRQGIGRNCLVSAIGAQGYFEGLHEGHVEKVLRLDLGHEVPDHLAFLVIADHK
jgi:hypothetical protein